MGLQVTGLVHVGASAAGAPLLAAAADVEERVGFQQRVAVEPWRLCFLDRLPARMAATSCRRIATMKHRHASCT
jgi:hypothetical protein